ncbi:hypothetical protein LSAT2_032967 [Lamellibrachia satsuma]|nr:hypothetical protein LSAT2_032967 [Lamellibrachia satsuma]
MGLRAQLQDVNSPYQGKLIAALKKSMETRLEYYEHSELFAVASTLDPRFKLLWADDEQSAIAKATVIRKMHCALNLLSPTHVTPVFPRTRGIVCSALWLHLVHQLQIRTIHLQPNLLNI